MRQVVSAEHWKYRTATFAHVAVVAALSATLLAAAGLAAAHLLPEGRWAAAADVITPLTGHIIIGGCGAVLACWWRRRAALVMSVAVATALIGHAAWSGSVQVGALWPNLSVGDARDHLRIYELNSWDENPDLPRLESALAAVGADVLVLAEADPQKVGLLARLKPSYPYQMSCAPQSECAMAILSRLPIVAGGAARNQYLVPPIAWARIDARSLGVGIVTVIGTHVHRPTRDPWVHARQMRVLTELIVQTKGPLVLAGDLNTGPWSASFRNLVAATGLVPSSGGVPTWPAYPVQLPQVALDHILVSPDLVVLRTGLGAATGSDHLPTFAEIGLRARGRASAR